MSFTSSLSEYPKGKLSKRHSKGKSFAKSSKRQSGHLKPAEDVFISHATTLQSVEEINEAISIMTAFPSPTKMKHKPFLSK
jgi:hypothetical protein